MGANDGAGRDHPNGAPDAEAEDVARGGPERSPQPEIMDALLDGVREGAEHSDHRQQERQTGPDARVARPPPSLAGESPVSKNAHKNR